MLACGERGRRPAVMEQKASHSIGRSNIMAGPAALKESGVGSQCGCVVVAADGGTLLWWVGSLLPPPMHLLVPLLSSSPFSRTTQRHTPTLSYNFARSWRAITTYEFLKARYLNIIKTYNDATGDLHSLWPTTDRCSHLSATGHIPATDSATLASANQSLPSPAS